jgi:regulator of replication initiation timing
MMSATMETLEVEQLHAQIARLIAESGKLQAEQGKLQSERAKLQAEERKLSLEVFWYPVAVSTALIGTVAGLTVALTKIVS